MEFDNQWKPKEKTSQPKSQAVNVKTIVGYLFIAFGSMVAISLIYKIFGLLTEPQEMLVFNTILAGKSNFDASFGGNDWSLSIPPELLSILLFIFLLGFIVKISIAFLQTGGRLLYGDFQKLMLKFNNMERRVGMSMNGINDEFKKLIKK